MQVKQSRVTSKYIPKDKIVNADHNVYDSVDEARKSEGDEKVVNLVNSAIRTNAMNIVRAEYNAPESRKKLRERAFNTITKVEFESFAGDSAKYELFLSKRMDELEAADVAAGKVPENDE